MSARYSTRYGRNLPNPNLGPEKANHFELGYLGNFGAIFNINTAVYYSQIQGKIVTVQLPNPHYPSALVDYDRNLDRTGFWGIELAPEFTYSDWFSGGLAFSFNQYSIHHSQSGVKVLTYFPNITLNAYMVFKVFKIVSLIPRFEYIGSRYDDTDGSTELDDYFLTNLKVSAELGKHFEISAAVENFFDVLYEIRRGSPMAGRSFNFNLTVKY
jgi:iron complex outermembrane receptor protein